MKAQAREGGLGLIEVVVALAIFAVGILTSYSLQLSALATYNSASDLLIATDLARDIISRIRSNVGQLENYSVEGLGGSEPSLVTPCTVTSCTPQQLAMFDLADLSGQLRGASERVSQRGDQFDVGGLMNARVCIRNRGRWLTVVVSWRARGDHLSSSSTHCSDSSAQPLVAGTSIRNYIITSRIGLEQ